MMKDKKIATRMSYGNALAELGDQFPDMIVLDADLAGATQSRIFRDKYPDRFIDCGICEGNMMSIAAGLSTTGLIPVAGSFAMFAAGRAFEQVRNSIGYPHLNVKIGATHAGISVGEDGASHQCLEDIALMRTIPGMTVLSPADDTEAKEIVRAALEMEGPVYMRFGRYATPVIYDENHHFEIGKGTLLREGKDVTIVATGICVATSIEAADLLAEVGIDAEVIDMASIKPLDEDIILASAAKTGKVITAEEHSIIGGLGSAVSECLSEKAQTPFRFARIGLRDQFGETGSAAQLIQKYGLDGEGICRQVKDFVQG